MTGIFLQAWQQLTAINFIFYYGATFFVRSGIRNPFLITIATNVVKVGMTVPGIYLVKVGRRRLLLIGAAGMLICEYLVTIIGVTISINNQAGRKVLIAFICINIALFAATWGSIVWVVTGEIFPLANRAKTMSLLTASNWLWNLVSAMRLLTLSTKVWATRTLVSRRSSSGALPVSGACCSRTF
ncbi:hypothetical protein FRC08_015736 [Ceratobasidium sp. 394]|nr:hypothetical protein FRC08_015736 [Ceratobasidium sp. 394]KAG9083496.1 hypothetical protein FS749_005981 [Ceratobasidium sp. UAMH 11750]